MLAHEELGVERARPSAEPGDRDDLALLGVVDHDRRDAGEIDEVDLQDAERDPGRDAGIDRVAAGLQDLEPGGGGEVMPGGDGVRCDGDCRAMGVAHGEMLPGRFVAPSLTPQRPAAKKYSGEEI